MNRHKREVSRERLIGISFIDILIQAIFVLFLALGVGYMDPIEREEAEEAKRKLHDICHRFNKDSTKPCYDYLIQIATKEAKGQKGSLHLCIAPKSFNKSIPSVFF
ncbi:MAG: hypothetical protein IPK86_03235 [Neisseriales bacterium]|nr:MAG: hypothetical protein IPK86_03235 [Neisseriales bacterium]